MSLSKHAGPSFAGDLAAGSSGRACNAVAAGDALEAGRLLSGGSVVVPQPHVPLRRWQDVKASSGGGSEAGLDASATYTLDLTGIEPHPVQGFHVKLTVNAEGSRGADVKHKVFWVTGCGPSPTTTTTTLGTTTSTSGATTTSTLGATSTSRAKHQRGD